MDFDWQSQTNCTGTNYTGPCYTKGKSSTKISPLQTGGGGPFEARPNFEGVYNFKAIKAITTKLGDFS